MLSQRERTWTTALIAGFWMAIVVFLAVIAEAKWFPPESSFRAISSWLYGIGSLLALVSGGITLANLHLVNFRESKTTRDMVTLDDHNQVIAIYRLGDATSHLPVIGTSVQCATHAPSEQSAPFISRTPMQTIHIAKELPQPEEISQELYQEFENLLRRNRKV